MIANPDRRRFLAGAAAVAAAPRTLFDGKTVTIGDRDYALTEILSPSTASLRGEREPGAEFAAAVLAKAVRSGVLIQTENTPTDRWGRITGPIRWRTNEGCETTLQEILLAEGAARVAPEGRDFDFIDRCYAAERSARDAALGLWSQQHWSVRDARAAPWSRGYHIYRGEIQRADDRNGRVYFNFGDDFRTDFTATVARRDFRRWRGEPAVESFNRALVEVRGIVLPINGPSIEIRHELQMRRIAS